MLYESDFWSKYKVIKVFCNSFCRTFDYLFNLSFGEYIYYEATHDACMHFQF